MAKDKKSIKFEAETKDFNKAIQQSTKEIKTLNNTLRLNQTQIKGNNESVDLLKKRVELLSEKYKEQSTIVDNTRSKYEKAVELYGENSKAAEDLKNKLIQEEAKQQSIANAISKANEQLSIQSSKLISAGKSLSEFGDRAKNVGEKVDNIGNKLSVLSAGIATVATASLKASIDFESAWTGVTKTVDGTEEQMKKIRQGILDMSTELPATAEEIAGVAENAGQLGIATDDILSFTDVMIKLGFSTNLSADEASSALAKFANVTKMSSQDYEKLGSTIVALGNNSATTEADIVSMATRLAATGELAGLSQAQILALATSMSSVGIEAEAGGSAMSKLLKQIQVAVETGSSDLKSFAKVAGMSTKDFKKAFQEDAVGALSSFIAGLNDTERNGKSAIAILDDMGITEVRLSNTVLSLANSSDIMTKSVELAGKAWSDNTALTEEASKRCETTEAKLTRLKNEVKKSAIALGDDLKPAFIEVLEEAKPMIENISSMVKSFNKLDSATKKNIINTTALVAAAGPATKVVGKGIQTLGNGTKTVGKFSTAIGLVGKTSTEAFKNASTGTQTLAKALTFLTTPTGLVTAAVTVAAAALVYFATKESEAEKEAKNLHKAINESKDSFDDYIETNQKSMEANVVQIDNVASLRQELTNLVDENGKVKDGYQARVDFILNQLNDALGTEYKLNGDTIVSYKELQNEIDKTIKKKRAQIILATEEENMKKAIEEQNEATNKQKEILDKIGMSYSNLKDRLSEYDTKIKEVQDGTASGIGMAVALKDEFKNITGLEYDTATELAAGYETCNETIKKSLQVQEKYQTDYALNVEGKYEEIGTTIKNISQDTKDASIKDLEEQTRKQSEESSKWLEIHKETNNNIAKLNSETTEKNLQAIASELAKRTQTIQSLSTDEISAWSTLANSSYEAYKTGISQVGPEMQKAIQQATGVIVEETPYAKELAEKFGNTVVQQLDRDTEFRKEAVDSLNAYIEGLSDEEKRNLILQSGIQNAEEVEKGLKEGKRLSEDQGSEILKGLYSGLENSSIREKIYNSVRGLASKLTGMFSIKASVNSQELPGHKDGLDYVPYDNYIARLHKGERVLTAQENRDYMNGNSINNKVANRSIVMNFYPQHMDEYELERAFKYVDKRYEEQY